jgi:hypothetical protein
MRARIDTKLARNGKDITLFTFCVGTIRMEVLPVAKDKKGEKKQKTNLVVRHISYYNSSNHRVLIA